MKKCIVAYGLTCAILAMPVMSSRLPVSEEKDCLVFRNDRIEASLSLTRPQFINLSVDSQGQGKFRFNMLKPSPAITDGEQTVEVKRTMRGVEYRGKNAAPTAPARWAMHFDATGVTLISCWSRGESPETVVLEFHPKASRATLLGTFDPAGRIRLPAILYLPGQGALRITGVGDAKATLGYDVLRTGFDDVRKTEGDYIKVIFPPAVEGHPRLEYRWELTTISPKVPGTEGDPRFNGFQRRWLNIFQINPRLRALSNNSISDTCAFCYYAYADIARCTPPLAPGFHALDMVRQSLDRILAGGKAYGLPGYSYDHPPTTHFPTPSLDTYPSLLIAAWDYAEGGNDLAWLEKNYSGVKAWADAMLAQDRDKNGLIEYHASGNSGSWTKTLTLRPANWWDAIGFGHEHAYSNALAYRALRCMAALARMRGNNADAAHYATAADKLQRAYFKNFFNTATGMVAGWKSADGQLHDYCFVWINSLAIHYGLVPGDKADAIMDKLMAKMKEVGFTRFDLGLPGNLISIAKKDFLGEEPRWGGGHKEDGSDAFQVYENGGATACYAFFTVAALYDLGRREEGDSILFPILDSIDKGRFEGIGANGMANDWKAWDGTPWGYEGFLVDNYYVMLAVLVRNAGWRPFPVLPGAGRSDVGKGN